MPNPFQHLEDIRKAAEIATRTQEEAKRRDREQKEKLRQDLMQTASEYDDTVMTVLGYLRDAAYPNLKLRSHRDKPSHYPTDRWHGKCAWSIGKWRAHSHPDASDYWAPIVLVELVFGEQNLPNRFSLSRMRYCHNSVESIGSIDCGLSHKELIESLNELHTSYAGPVERG